MAENGKILHDLRERATELDCLYGFAKIVGKPDISRIKELERRLGEK